MATTKADRVRIAFKHDEMKRELRWTFGAGLEDVVYVMPEIVCDDPTALPALVNGYKQKIGDAMAIAADTTTGKPATLAEKREAASEVANRLQVEREWNAANRGGGGVRAVSVDALVAAIAATLKRNVVAVRAFVESKDDEARRALANSEQFREAYALAVAAQRPVRPLDEDLLAAVNAIPE